MAMIKCRECGNEISSRAESCPHCGAKTRFGMAEAEKKQGSVTVIVLVILSVIGTIIFVSGLFTMIGDINDYHDIWRSGYNYKSPLTEHEMGVIMQMIIGIALDIGGSVGFVKLKKDMES